MSRPIVKKAIKKLMSVVSSKTKTPAQKLSKGLPRKKGGMDEVRQILGDGNPISRMDDAARKAFARRNLK